MEVSQRRPKYVIGPDGGPLTIADLPAPGMKRWVIITAAKRMERTSKLRTPC